MTPHDRANAYLVVPPSFADYLGRLSWSFSYDSLLDGDGNTFALVEELALILEGVFAAPPVPPFAYVLVALHRMKRGPHAVADAYRQQRGAAAVGRNAGLLIAELCREMPVALSPPEWPAVQSALDARRRFGRPTLPSESLEPSLSPATADQLLTAALAKFTPDVLAAWLTHGSPPTAAAEQIAKPLESLPARLGKLFDLAQYRPRLVGAAFLAPTLDAALAFPPRRPSPDARPQGGYADVTTRGQPDRLLLSQFALDSDEFVRRFAEKELLYFRPEEPHAPEPPDRVIVLDQGVRTWGHVRLALVGGAMALLRKHGKKFGATYLVHSGFHDPLALDIASPEELAEALEASDLTAAPTEAIISAVTGTGDRDRPRDLILLTHPRSLAEPGVLMAINARRETDRLFTVTVDAAGQAELSEWGTRGPVRLRSFRVDLVAAENAKVRARQPTASLGAAPGGWTGDVEPIGFPFRAGVVAEPITFGFDGLSEWLVTASREGIVQAFALNGDPPEVLPRAYRDGVVLKQVEAILGVHDGVVVCGRMMLGEEPAFVSFSSNAVTNREPVLISSSTTERFEWLVAAHYDRVRRVVTIHRLAKATGTVRWFVSTNRQEVGIRSLLAFVQQLHLSVNLYTLGRTELPRETEWNVRTDAPPYALPVWTRWSSDDSFRGTPYLFLEGQSFEVRRAETHWPRFEPRREGQPLLAGTVIEKAQLANDVLVLATFLKGERQKLVFRGPEARLIYHLPRADRGSEFALSPDGRLLAYKSRVQDVAIVETASSALPRTVASTARLHNGLTVSFIDEPFVLSVGVGDYIHTFAIEVGKFTHTRRRGRPPVRAKLAAVNPASYDASRFPHKEMVESATMTAVVDRLGQVVVMIASGVLLSVIVRRDRAAAIAADGTCWGEVALLGCPATPNAAEKLAEWLTTRGGCNS